MSKVELEGSQINILLNLAFLEGKSSFTIRSPVLDIDLFEIELKRRTWTCESCLDEDEFHQKVEEAKSRAPESVRNEIPGYDALAKAIISTGVFDAEEFGEDFMHAIGKMKGNPGKYSVCIDTNVLYNRFVTSILDPYLKENLAYYPKFVISNLMKNEIEEKMNRRYNKKETEQLAELGGDIYHELENQYKLESRKAKLAHSELHHMENEVRPEAHGEEKFLKDNEQRDLRILREYEESGESTGKRPLVFGFEASFKHKEEDKELEFIHLDHPENLLDVKVGHQGAHKIIRYISQLYGVIQLKGLGCRALGMWEDMDEIDFERGRIRFVFEESSSLYEELDSCAGLSTAIREAMS